MAINSKELYNDLAIPKMLYMQNDSTNPNMYGRKTSVTSPQYNDLTNPEIHRLTSSFTSIIERHGQSQKLSKWFIFKVTVRPDFSSSFQFISFIVIKYSLLPTYNINSCKKLHGKKLLFIEMIHVSKFLIF